MACLKPWFASTYHVDRCQNTGTVPQNIRSLLVASCKRDIDDGEYNIGTEKCEQEEKLKPGRQRSNIDGLAQLNLSIVSLAKDWGIEHMAFQEGDVGRRDGEVSLAVVAETGYSADDSVDFLADFPDDDGHGNRAADDEEIVGQGLVLVVVLGRSCWGTSPGLGSRSRRVARTHGDE